MQNAKMKVVYRCSVLGCKNTEEDRFLKFYSLPYKEPEVCKEWIKRMADPQLISMQIADVLKATLKICEIHFHYICKTGFNSELQNSSLPTLHLPMIKGVQPKTNCFFVSPSRIDYIATNFPKEKRLTQVETCTEICRICFSKGILYDIEKSIYKKKEPFVKIIKYLVPDYELNTSETRENICLDCIKLILTSYLTVIRIETALDVFSELYSVTSLTKKSLNLAYQNTIDMKSILEDCDLKISLESCQMYSVKNTGGRFKPNVKEVPKPIEKQPVEKQPIRKQAIPKEPIGKQAIAKQPIAKQTITKQPIEKQPIGKQTITKQPIEKAYTLKELLNMPASSSMASKETETLEQILSGCNKTDNNENVVKKTGSETPVKYMKIDPSKCIKLHKAIVVDSPNKSTTVTNLTVATKQVETSKQVETGIYKQEAIASTSQEPETVKINANKAQRASSDNSTAKSSMKLRKNNDDGVNEKGIEMVLIKEENAVFLEDNPDLYEDKTDALGGEEMEDRDYDVSVKEEGNYDDEMFTSESNYISCYEPQCNFKCPSVEEYARHIQTHKHVVAFTCHYCHAICKGLKQYYSHLKTHTQPSRKRTTARQTTIKMPVIIQEPEINLPCPECGVICKDRAFLAVHLGRFHGPLVECPICHKKKRKVLMGAHLRTHRDQLRCLECNLSFDSTKLFNRHELLNHPKICLICSKKFSVVRYLRKHIMRHGEENGGIECPYCHRIYKSQASLRIHFRYRAKNNNVCMPPFCKETYGRLRQLRKIPIVCPICGKAVRDYVTHLRRHTSQNEFKCSECPYESKYTTNFRRHMLTHSGDKPFLCTHCGQSFIQKTILDSHSKLHDFTAEPIKCKYCEATFNTKFEFKVHRLSHGIGKHNRSLYGSRNDPHGEHSREYICSICSKSWASKALLQGHLRAHSDVRPYSCDICPASFKFKFALKVHTENVHEDRRPFSCRVCKKGFRHELALREHSRTHTGERLNCDRCDKTFANSSNRSKHMRDVHNVRFRTLYRTHTYIKKEIRRSN